MRHIAILIGFTFISGLGFEDAATAEKVTNTQISSPSPDYNAFTPVGVEVAKRKKRKKKNRKWKKGKKRKKRRNYW